MTAMQIRDTAPEYVSALMLALEKNFISAARLHIELNVSMERANDIVQRMEDAGILTPKPMFGKPYFKANPAGVQQLLDQLHTRRRPTEKQVGEIMQNALQPLAESPAVQAAIAAAVEDKTRDRASSPEQLEAFTPEESGCRTIAGIAGAELRAFIERYERLEEEVQGLKADQKDILADAKSRGYSVPIIRQVMKLRKMDRDERQEQETLLDLYLQALGMTPAEKES